MLGFVGREPAAREPFAAVGVDSLWAGARLWHGPSHRPSGGGSRMPSGTNLERLLAEGGPVLAEGSVVERVRRGWPDLLDPLLMNAPMIYSREGREVLNS